MGNVLTFNTRQFLEKAKTHERKYEWVEAAKAYEQISLSESQNGTISADTWEQIGLCYNYASRQAVVLDEFLKLRRMSVEAYRRSADEIREDSAESRGKKAQRNALACFADSWLATSPIERSTVLDESVKLGKESLENYRVATDEMSYGIMCNDLLLFFFERLCVACDWKELGRIAHEGINYGQEAINVLSKLGNTNELLRAYSMASLLNWYTANFTEQDERARKELSQRSLDYSQKALELSKHSESCDLGAMANWAAAFATMIFTEKIEEALRYAEEMSKHGTVARDNYLKGVANYVLAFAMDAKTMREADPEQKKKGHSKIIEYSENAINSLRPLCQDFYIAETYLFYVESYSALGSDVDASPDERRRILKKAVEAGRKGLEHAKLSGSNDALGSTLHALSKAVHFYSNLEVNKSEKKKLLEEALLYRNEIVNLVERTFPSNDWLTGVNKNYLGLIKLDLFKVEDENQKKRDLLKDAADDLENSVLHCKKWIQSRPVPTNIAAVADYEDSLGGILDELFLLTKDEKLVQRAIGVYEDEAKLSKKINLPSRAAESYWKAAMNCDRLDKHIKAAEHFGNAFAEYREASQLIPHFAEFYLDYASYMNAWSEIEKAKSAHEHENYADASKHYEKVAGILEPSKLWSHLSSNFLAWSLLETGEDLSRRENNVESIEAFTKAANLFEQARGDFEQETNKIERTDERNKANELCKASLQRKDYCLARVNLEEARIADRNGNHSDSAAKYESAAIMLEGIIEKEQDEKDIKQIASMCRAWQKMKTADTKLSPEFYREASELFLKAKEHSTKDKTAMLTSGNAAICEALEHETMFEATRQRSDFLRAKQCLENAGDCYLKAGLDSASAWTSATEMLLDASNYTTSAEAETDSDVKMKNYMLAEKCLERSADLFEKAHYTGRKDEVLKLLTKLKEKREFALSLGELLLVPREVNSTNIISTPRMSVEEPVGLVRFERAFVQANLVTHQKELVVGETLDLEIQLANLGKETAFLIGIERLVPDGFDLIEKPEKSQVSDSGLSLKGRRFSPLETADIELKLKPRRKGEFKFIPQIRYIDESGERKTCELEQTCVTVKELGIRGWLKGQF